MKVSYTLFMFSCIEERLEAIVDDIESGALTTFPRIVPVR